MKGVALIFPFLLALISLLICITYLDMHNNFMDWRPLLDNGSICSVIIAVLCNLIVMICGKYLVKEVYYSFILLYIIPATLIVIFGIFPQYQTDSEFMSRHHNSPIWYKTLCSMLLVLPGLSLLYYYKKRS
jgi:hypothetical protein